MGIGAAYAKLVAQKSKGMPLICFSLAKLENSAASEAMMNLSLELFKSYKNMQNLFIKGCVLFFKDEVVISFSCFI
ncbi:hypothetical protein AAG906_023972 [Vitis piasezkii]|uniref:Uncharacterized protein n=1 Tax=Vitis vinifera TaxID=29760 RepID=A0A438KJH5_VITVI|nr:hypothetical protein CK203_002077 [Vitis vinifera]